MSLSTSESFAAKAKPKRKRPAPFPIRLSPEERALLERKAGRRPLGTYIRARLLGAEEERRKPVRSPSVDYALLGRVLGVLGESELARHLCLLAVAAEAGRVHLAEEDRSALRDACAAVTEMRALLVKALGLRSGGAP
ncbi:MAG: hypothetical protein RIM84_17135 [Alphaproteobacteria bacterium]